MSRVYSARVRDGVIVADDVALAEGATVTVFDEADPAAGECELTPQEEDAVEVARAELARGEGLSVSELMTALRRDRAEREVQRTAASGTADAS